MFTKQHSLGEKMADALFDVFLPQKQQMSAKKKAAAIALAVAGFAIVVLGYLYEENDAQ